MSGRVVDRRRVRPAVARPAAPVAVDGCVEADVQPVAGRGRHELDRHEHRVPGGVGDVLGLDPVLAALRRRRDGARHAGRVGLRLHRVGHVARLQVGERRPVGDDVLERLDVRVVDRRVVDVAEHAVRDRVPDLRGRVAGGAEAVLARQAEVGERARGSRRVVGDDREDVRRRVVGEGDLRVVRRDGEGDVGAAGDATCAVVLVEALVDRDLPLVRAGRERRRLERVDAVPIRVLEPRAQAGGIPVTRAAELGLEASGRDGDHRVPVVGDPVALVVVVELDVRARGEVERDVRAIRLRAEAVVLGPRVVQRSLVLEAARGQRERALPDVVGGVVGEMGRRAVRLPVARAAELRLQRAGDRDGRRVRRVRCGRDRKQDERGPGEREQHQLTLSQPGRPTRGRRSGTGDPRATHLGDQHTTARAPEQRGPLGHLLLDVGRYRLDDAVLLHPGQDFRRR